MQKKTLNIAITGGVGCGKSTATGFFRELGFPVFSADEICHAAIECECVKIQLVKRWSDDILDGNGRVVRSKIAEKVFQNRDDLDFLNSLLHSLALEELEKVCQGERDDGGQFARFVEVPLLYETGMEKIFDRVICVWASECRTAGIANRAAFQMSADEKLERADFGIINNVDKEFLFQQCREMIEVIRKIVS